MSLMIQQPAAARRRGGGQPWYVVDPYTYAIYPLSANGNDASANSRHLTAQSVTTFGGDGAVIPATANAHLYWLQNQASAADDWNTANFSLACWVKISATGTLAFVSFGHANESTLKGPAIRRDSGRAWFETGNDGGSTALDSGVVIATNEWYHIVATVASDGTGNYTRKIYVNGAAPVSGVTARHPQSAANLASYRMPLAIGAAQSSDGSSPPFATALKMTGNIQDVIAAARTWSDAEAAALYAVGRGNLIGA